MDTGPTQANATRIGRYEIVRRIGQGGMAEVFLARTVGPGGIAKRVCIKRIRPEALADPRALERFSQEARTSFELQHANIVTVFDFGRDGQELFLAMEWIDGCDLATLLRALRDEGRALPPIVAAHVAASVAKALAYAHGRTDHEGRPAGVVHRDVTPSNILLSRRGQVLLTDFGIARALHKEGAPAGTPAYMAPEQARGEPGDARSDLYALGLVLAEMLLGRALRAERTFEAARHAVAMPPLLDVPPAIAELVRALLGAEPRDRPASAAIVERALAAPLAEATLRDGHSPEAELAALVERAAPRPELPAEHAAPPTEAGATVAVAPAEQARPRPRRLALIAALGGAAALAAWLLVPRREDAGSTPTRGEGQAPPPPPTRPRGGGGREGGVDPPESPTPAPATVAPPTSRRRPASAAAQLRVTAPGSWVAVYLDGQKLGDDAGLFRIPAGRHQLRVTNPPLRFERVLTIEARPGETLEYQFHPGK